MSDVGYSVDGQQATSRNYHKGDSSFENQANARSDFETAHENEREAVETRLMRALREWFELSPAEQNAPRAAESTLGLKIESLLTGAFRMSKQPDAQRWWLDGVMSLSLTQPSPTQINGVGATIWAGKGPGFYLAPFECEFYFAKPSTPECERIVLRFGKRNSQGSIVQLAYDSNAAKVVESRPKVNSDWAFAVEIS